MAQMLYTGPDGVTRIIDVPNSGAPNFISGSTPGSTVKTGLPAVIPENYTYPGSAQFATPMTPTNQQYLQPMPESGVYAAEGQAQFKNPTYPTNQNVAVEPPAAPRPTTFRGSAGQKVPFGKVKAAPTGTAAGGAAAAEAAGASAVDATLLNRLKGLALNPEAIGAAGLMVADALIGKPARAVDEFGPIDSMTMLGNDLEAEAADPRTSPAMGFVGNSVGGLLKAPGRVYQGVSDGLSSAGQFAQDLFTPKGVLADREAKARAGMPIDTSGQDSANFLASLGAGLTGDASSTPIDLGAVPMYDVPNLPMPGLDQKPDYTEVRNLVAQMRPQAVDEEALNNTRGMAVLAGISAGLLDSSASPGEILLRMGMGGLAGQASVDQAINDANDKFKNSMQDYLRIAVGVEKSAAEDDAQFAQRVYDTKIRQMSLNYEHAQKMGAMLAPKLREVGGKLYMERTDPRTGRVALENVSTSPTEKFERIAATLSQWGMDPKLATSVAMTAGTGDDPRTALPAMTVGMLKMRGQTEALLNLISGLGDDGKKFVERYNAMGSQLMASPTADKSAVEKEAAAARDTLLMQIIMNSPSLMQQAMELGGVPSYIRDPYSKMLEKK